MGTVVVKGPNGPVNVKVEDCGAGTYRASYDSLPPGQYEIETMVDGQPVSKYKAQVRTQNPVPNSKMKHKTNVVQKPRKSLQYALVHSSGGEQYPSGNVGTNEIIDRNGRNLCFIEGPTLEDLMV